MMDGYCERHGEYNVDNTSGFCPTCEDVTATIHKKYNRKIARLEAKIRKLERENKSVYHDWLDLKQQQD